MNKCNPKVSLGLPVFNGEKYISKCLDSLISQTFSDFEIIICDNHSTDLTEEICHYYKKLDDRICYHRNLENIGAAANFNLAFKLSQGKYFKWVAHDDLCLPDFLARCVSILDCKPDVVLAHTKTKLIDANDVEIGLYDLSKKTDSDNPVTRFAELLIGHMCFEIFGLIRRDILKKTPLMGNYANGDGVLLSRLALLGRFEEIEDYLFLSRRHPEQSISMANDFRAYSIWFNPKLSGKVLFPHWKIQLEFFKSIKKSSLSMRQKYKCYKHIYWSTLLNKENLINDFGYQIGNIKNLAYFSISKKCIRK